MTVPLDFRYMLILHHFMSQERINLFFFLYTQMMEKLEDALTAMEDNMANRLDRIERRLDSLEGTVC